MIVADGLADQVQQAHTLLSWARCCALGAIDVELFRQQRHLDTTEWLARWDDRAKFRRARWDVLREWVEPEHRAKIDTMLAALPDDAREWLLTLMADETDRRGSLGQLIAARFGPTTR